MTVTGKKNNLLNFAINVFQNSQAYHKFVISNGFKSVRNFPSRFEDLPFANKKNYIEKYPIEERILRTKELADYYMICTSSGSTGEPTIWPRDYELDKKAIEFNYSMYKDLFDVDKKKTLVVVTFGLGAWTAGMVTSRLCWEMPKNSRLSVVTPGLDKEVSLRVIRQLSKYYDQTIITGYPPFLIELIEYGYNKGFDFKKINTKIHFTSARMLENQRTELSKMISKNGVKYDVLGFYASSEAGIIGIENPKTVEILKFASKDKKFSQELFKSPVPPSFVIYNPKSRFLEVHNGKLIITINQPVPLIRYDTEDRGGLFNGEYLFKTCKRFGYHCSPSLKKEHFAYIYGRGDAVRLLSNIYTEDVLFCLKRSKLNKKLTGNFKYGLVNKGLKNVLKVIVFLKPGEKTNKTDKSIFTRQFVSDLAIANPDFNMVKSGINFNFDIEFSYETNLEYKGGKFDFNL